MKKILFISLLSLLISSKVYTTGDEHGFRESNLKPEKPVSRVDSVRHLEVQFYIHHITDINFRDQEYKLELWMYITSKDSVTEWDELPHQIQVAGAKEMTVTEIPLWRPATKNTDSIRKPRILKKLVKLNCTMSQDWHLDNYPFDKQKLDIIIYTTRSTRWLELEPGGCKFTYNENAHELNSVVENGWFVDNQKITVDSTIQKDIFDDKKIDKKKYSAIHISIPLWRTENFALFIKLFIGMYVSFFVAFLAFFINLNHADSKFGLTVGGLFAAIGNKYIMESILPQTSGLTIVDTLHTFTIISILLIILFSAVSLYRSEHDQLKNRKQKIIAWIDKYSWILILVPYLALNIYWITWGLKHHGF
jgi:hypothetical protein